MDFASKGKCRRQHIDSVHPEIIILAALILAVKFLDDAQQSTRVYATEWGRGMWSCEQLNFTQLCVFENLAYRLLPLWKEEIINEALEDMERAGQQYSPGIYDDDEMELARLMKKGVNDVKAVLSPAEMSMVENVRGISLLSLETKEAYSGNGQCLGLPDRTLEGKEPFPAYSDPMADERFEFQRS